MKQGDKDPSKYSPSGKTLISQLEASKKYDSNLYKTVIRLPASYKDAIRVYLNQYNKHHPDNKLTFNSWIKEMIDNELFK